MEDPQKSKRRVTIWSSNPTSGHIAEENYNLKRYMYPHVYNTLYMIAKMWKQPKYPSSDE